MSEIESKLIEENENMKELFNFNGNEIQLKHIKELFTNNISNSKNGTLAYADVLKGECFIQFLKERLLLIKDLLSDRGSVYLHIDYKIGHYVKVMMDDVFGIGNFRNDITRIKCNPKNFKRIGYGNIKDLMWRI